MATPVRISVIGAGSGVFSLGLVKDICLTPNLAGSEVSFMDLNAERLDTVHRLAVRFASELGADLRFSQTLERKQSLQDADFVINTADVLGHHHARHLRETTARHGYYYGAVDLGDYYQFDLMVSVAHDIERICPDAWLIQSANPVFDGCTLMTRETNVKLIGLCHGHYGVYEIADTLGLDQARVTWEAPGLNHCIWLTKFLYDGKDAYPQLEAWIDDHADAYWRTHQATRTHDIQMARGTIHQFRMYGLMPIGDTPRTSTDTSNWWYHTDISAKKHWFGEPFGGPDTEIARPQYVDGLQKRLVQMSEAVNDPSASVVALFGATKTREQQVPIVDALTNNVQGQFQVNVPNAGRFAFLPDDVVVEGQAVVDATGVHPLIPSPLSRKIELEQILPRWLEMERNLEAYRSGDVSMLLWSALNNHQSRTYDQAVAAMQELLAMPEHKKLRDHFRGFEGNQATWFM